VDRGACWFQRYPGRCGLPNGRATQAPKRYRNQYQTASDRYLSIGADTHGAGLEMCQNGPKMEVSGAIPTLASIPNSPLFSRVFAPISGPTPPNPTEFYTKREKRKIP
jgi:hypothetical protein